MVQMFARRRFAVYAVIGGSLLACTGYFVVRSQRQLAELRAFEAERRGLLAAWITERPLPKPLVGFGFEARLTKVDLRWSASQFPFPPDRHVEIVTRRNGEFLNELPGTPMLSFDPQRINEPLDVTSEELADDLMEALRAGLPDDYEQVVQTPRVTDANEPVELISCSVSPSGHSGVWIALRVDATNRQVSARHAIREAFPGSIDTRVAPNTLDVSPAEMAQPFAESSAVSE